MKFPKANHPQADGQTERVNALLKEYFRHYHTGSQSNWVELLETTQSCSNLHQSSSTKKSLLCLRQQPLKPYEVAKTKLQGKCPTSYRYVHSQQELIDETKDSLAKDTRKMKKYTNQKRRPNKPINVGDIVFFLKLPPKVGKN